MGFQVEFESENAFAQSNVSRYRVPGGWSSSRKRATGQFSVHARNDQRRSIRRFDFMSLPSTWAIGTDN